MKTLRKKNRTHNKRKINRRSKRQNNNKRKTIKIHKSRGGGAFLPPVTTRGQRERSGNQAPVLEVFQQLTKTYVKFKKGTPEGDKQRSVVYRVSNHDFHKGKLIAALKNIHPDIIEDLRKIYESFKTTGGDIPKTRFRGEVLPRSLTRKFGTTVDPVDKRQIADEEKRTAQKEEERKAEEKRTAQEQEEPSEADGLLEIYTNYLINDLDEKYTKDIFDGLDKEGLKIERVKLLITELFTNNLPIPKKKEVEIDENLNLVDDIKKLNKVLIFTRHGPSCNNLVSDGQAIAAPFQITKEVTKRKLDSSHTSLIDKKVREPSLSDGGIERLINFKLTSKQKDIFNSDHVFVSCLIRTWMTAIILYGINPVEKDKPLYLCVSPFLKEYYQYGIKDGNFPVDVDKQIDQIKIFLSFLKSVLSDKAILVDEVIFQFPRRDDKVFENITITINKKVFENIPIKIPKNKKVFIDETKNVTTEFVRYDHNHVEPEPEPEQIKSGGVLLNDPHISDFYGLKTFGVNYASSLGIVTKRFTGNRFNDFYNPLNYAYNGKLNEFISWLQSNTIKLSEYLATDKVHIIGHSNLMKNGLEQIDKVTGKYYYKLAVQQDILKTNAWSLKINKDIKNIELLKGIPKKLATDSKWNDSLLCTLTHYKIDDKVMIKKGTDTSRDTDTKLFPIYDEKWEKDTSKPLGNVRGKKGIITGIQGKLNGTKYTVKLESGKLAVVGIKDLIPM